MSAIDSTTAASADTQKRACVLTAQDAINIAIPRAYALTAMMRDRDEAGGGRWTMAPHLSSEIAAMIADELVLIQAAINVITVGTPEGHSTRRAQVHLLRRAASNHGPCGRPFWTGALHLEGDDASTDAPATTEETE